MNAEKRRENILKLLAESDSPLSGTDLAKCLAVSRQVIVQDIALLRAVNKNILDELCTIVDLGGHILDVVVAHEIYGQITCDLIINSRQDAKSFVEQCEKSHAKGLSTLTDGVHYHTIEAETEDVLDRIEQTLSEKGYLLSD